MCATMKTVLLFLLVLVAVGCGSEEPVSASPEAGSGVAWADVAPDAGDAQKAPQDASADVSPVDASAPDVVTPADAPPEAASPDVAVVTPPDVTDAARDDAVRPCRTVADCGTLQPSLLPSCQMGQCVDVCPAGFAECDGNPVNGCEARLNQRETCGSCSTWCRGVCSRFEGGYRCS